jgi:hypothetical protein
MGDLAAETISNHPFIHIANSKEATRGPMLNSDRVETPTGIDITLTNQIYYKVHSWTVGEQDLVSDHFPITFNISYHSTPGWSPHIITTFSKNKWSAEDFTETLDELAAEIIQRVDLCDNIDEAIEVLTKAMVAAGRDLGFVVNKTLGIQGKHNTSYWTEECQSLKRKKRRWERKLRRAKQRASTVKSLNVGSS